MYVAIICLFDAVLHILDFITTNLRYIDHIYYACAFYFLDTQYLLLTFEAIVFICNYIINNPVRIRGGRM